MRESPAPPPCAVAYTPGVSFKISGRSREPSLRCMSALGTSEKATGVSRILARSATMMISLPRNTSGMSSTNNSTASASTTTGLRCSLYPIKLTTSVWLPTPTLAMANCPSRSVEAPRSTPSIYTLAPGSDSPVSASRTVPFSSAADRAEWTRSRKEKSMTIGFMGHLRGGIGDAAGPLYLYRFYIKFN